MMLAMRCTLPSLRAWGHANALPVLDVCRIGRCQHSGKQRSTMSIVRSQPQRDVGNLTAPFVSNSVDGNSPDIETFLEQVGLECRVLMHVKSIVRA